MFRWISGCWGGMATNITQFQQARLACTLSDWTIPNQQQLAILIQTFRGNNPQTQSNAAFMTLITHLEEDQQKNNPAYILKNILILDFAVQGRVLLEKISQYENKRLLKVDSTGLEISSSLKNLISSYYIYVKEKAKIYIKEIPTQVTNRKLRGQYLIGLEGPQLKKIINNCLRIQTLILDISDKYLHGNKNVQIIQYIFASFLKCYLFCYSVVAIIIKIFISRYEDMNKQQLNSLYRLGRYFNQDYTRNFLLFIERNKGIEAFKNIKYNQFIVVDEVVLGMVKNRISKIKKDNNENQIPMTAVEMPFKFDTEMMIELEAAVQNQELLTNNHRKPLKLQKQISFHSQQIFTNYQNFYSQDFIIAEQQNKNSPQKKQNGSFRLKHKLTFYKDIDSPMLKHDYLLVNNSIDKETWSSWKNIYANQ